MDILKIGILGVAGVLLTIPLKNHKPEFGAILSLSVCICIFVYIVSKLEVVLDAVGEMIALTGIQEGYMKTMIKMLGITYISEFSADICREAGQQSIAGQIEIFAKLSLFALSMPVLLVLVETIGELL